VIAITRRGCYTRCGKMQHSRWFVFLAVGLLSSSVHAQEVVPQPSPPTPEAPATPSAPEPPAADALAEEEEEPPPPPRPVARRKPPVVVQEAPAAGAGFGIELATSGFASGTLQGGLMMGLHLNNGTLLGARLNYVDETQTAGSRSVSSSTVALGLAARFPVIGSKAGLDLAVALDLAYLKSHADAGVDPDVQVPAGASGFQVGIGPQLRYWIHPNVAVGYLVQASHTSITLDQKSADGETLAGSKTAFAGNFTVTAGF